MRIMPCCRQSFAISVLFCGLNGYWVILHRKLNLDAVKDYDLIIN